MRIGVFAVGCMAVVVAHAQSGAAGFFNPLSASQNGIHLYSVSAYGGYFSGGAAFGLPTVGAATQSPGAFTVAGGSASLGWSRSVERSTFSIQYSPSYVVYPDRTEQNALGHSFSLNWNRKLGQKWSISTSATGLIANQEQMLFSSNAFGLAASLPTTFEDLAGAVLLGKFTDAQLAASLTGSIARVLPEQTYLYGQRIMSSALTAGLSYSPSGRSSVHVSVSGTRVQGLSNNGERAEAAGLIPQTTAGSASFGWGYSLSPRTNIGIEVSTARMVSKLQDGYASNASFSIGRTMSQHWFVQGRAGGGILLYTRDVSGAPQKPQYTAGGGLGYKVRSHALLASYDRTIGDAYGLGAGFTSVAAAGWSWRAPGGKWSFNANYGYQRTDGSSLYNTESWRAAGGVARSLNSHIFMSVQYAYFTLPAIPGNSFGSQGSQSGVTMSLSWSPSSYR